MPPSTTVSSISKACRTIRKRAEKIVGFDQLERDIAANALPNFAHIVPNQCDDMHGLDGPGVEGECEHGNQPGLIGRGDRAVGELVEKIMATPRGKLDGNVAIVITFDEGGRAGTAATAAAA